MTPIHSNRETALMSLRHVSLRSAAALLAAASIGLTACSSDKSSGTSPGTGSAYLRIVNSAFQTTSTGTYAPLTIDVLIDSSTSAPGVAALAGNSIADGPSGPKNNVAKYFPVKVGVRSFVARRSGLNPLGPSFYTTSASTDPSCTPQQYLPRQQLTANTFYTLIIAGLNPARTVNSTGDSVNVLPASGVGTCPNAWMGPGFPIGSISSVDDPFTPPTTTATGTEVLQARIHFWNAAPFTGSDAGTGGSLRAYITTTMPADQAALNALSITAFIGYRSQSSYVNFTAGTFWVTLSDGSNIVYRAQHTFNAGEVHSMIIQNTLPPGATSFNPSAMPSDKMSYTKITDIIDNKFTL